MVQAGLDLTSSLKEMKTVFLVLYHPYQKSLTPAPNISVYNDEGRIKQLYHGLSSCAGENLLTEASELSPHTPHTR